MRRGCRRGFHTDHPERGVQGILDFIDACEELGIDSLWFSDRIIGATHTLEPTTLMAFMAARAPTMKLGTGATAAAKAGAGGTIVTYETGSQEALDTSPPATSDKGAGSGYRVTYICTWVAGDVVESALAEVILSHETPITDTTGTLPDTLARFVFGATIDKQSGDSLVVTWNVDFLGA